MANFKNKVLCSYPFNSLFMSGNADLKFCCASQTILGNANTDDVDDVMNNNTSKEIREYMLMGEWHPNCIICKEIESVGGNSTRTQEMFNFKDEDINSENFKLEFIDLRWNNTCNLSCNYCVPQFSHKWAKIKNEKITRIHKSKEQRLFDFIEKHKNTVSKIMILGGEPLLHKQNLTLTDLAPNAFYYTLTNLSLDNLDKNPVVQRFLSMKHFDWGVSFETIGKRFEYVRHGANWDVFDSNLKFIQKQANERKFRFCAHPLYFMCSAFNIVDYYDYVYENQLFHDGIYWQTLIHNSGGLLNNFTKKIKEKAIREIDRCKQKYPNASGLDMLISIQENLILDLDKPNDEQYLKKVLDELNTLEKNYLKDKKYSFKDLWPEVYNWLLEGV